jgi:SAM-dependent methyltransferase
MSTHEPSARNTFDCSDPSYPVIRAMLADQWGERSARLNLNIAGDDDMYNFAETSLGGRARALSAYFAIGLQIVDIIDQLVRSYFGDWNKIRAYLDFACGHGRTTRFLTGMLPVERVWVSEILPTAVRFQAEEFGYRSVQSTTSPRDFNLEQKFDLVFVCSLFTHLPERTFTDWLAKLYSLLSPGGLLVFSVHDQAIMPEEHSLNQRGFCFGAASEIRDLNPNDYGFCFVNEAFVREAIRQATGQTDYGRLRRGLVAYQDMYVVGNARNKDFSRIGVDFATGYVDSCVLDRVPPSVSLRGWAASMT